jgi:hypothetical protein
MLGESVGLVLSTDFNQTTISADPIVSAGKISSHAHSLLGANSKLSSFCRTTNEVQFGVPSSDFGLSASFDGLRNSTCTTCVVDEDKSLYWFPPLVCAASKPTFSS